jgi:hypothetical protein
VVGPVVAADARAQGAGAQGKWYLGLDVGQARLDSFYPDIGLNGDGDSSAATLGLRWSF